jgi:hypothetical protein
MYRLDVDITIAGKRFKRVNSVEVTKSRLALGSTAVISLPATAILERKGQYLTNVETAKTFKYGDPVTVKLGYDGVLQEEFTGYVSKIEPGFPTIIECIDETFHLRRKTLNKSWKSVTLKDVLVYSMVGTGVTLAGEIPVITLAPFYLKETTAASAIEKLKEEYGLEMWLNGKNLYVSLATPKSDTTVKHVMGSNVIDHSLEWKSEDDVRLKIKAIGWRKNNTKVTVETGDQDGEARTLHFYNITDKKELEKITRNEIQKYKYSGFSGDFTTFLIPFCEPGNASRFINRLFNTNRDGDYIIDKVVTTANENGGRRKVTLGIKTSING